MKAIGMKVRCCTTSMQNTQALNTTHGLGFAGEGEGMAGDLRHERVKGCVVFRHSR